MTLEITFDIDLPDWGKALLLIFSLIVGIGFAWRFGKEKDIKFPKWMLYSVSTLMAYTLGLFTILGNIALADSYSNQLDALFFGSRYQAKVMDHTVFTKKGKSTYRSIYEIQLKDGSFKDIDAGYSSSSKTPLGTIHQVYYNVERNTLLILRAPTIILLCGLHIVSILFTMIFVGLIIYALGFDMTRFWSFCGIIVPGFILFLMIAFDVLLIYVVATFSAIPIWGYILLGFIIIILSLSIIGLIRIMIGKDDEGDEDEDEEDDVY